jgi:hypothetical protein
MMRRVLVLVAGLTLAVSACSAPVGVARVDPRTVQRNLTASAVFSAARPSSFTRNVLHEQDCFVLFQDQPEEALRRLHGVAASPETGTWRELFALTEMSFIHAEASGDRAYYLAAAVYPWAYLFPEGSPPPGPFDSRVRIAADIYNRSLTRAFLSPETSEIELRGGAMELPFGTLSVDFDPASLRWLDRQLVHLVPVAELEVTGLPTRYRRSGIGAPLAASTEPLPTVERSTDIVDPNLKVSVTALLRIEDARGHLAGGRLSAVSSCTTPSMPTR